MEANKLTTSERRAIFSIASIMSLRVLGLFMVLPVFSLYASQLEGATPTLIGLSLGIYGLFQGIFQIPLGALSDRIGRKPVVIMGLIVFAIGSLVAAYATSMTWLIIGRSLQGAGAVGSTLLALMADLTRENVRTKAMAITGISFGFSFTLAMLLGPLLSKWLPLNELFLIACLLGCAGIAILITRTPTPERMLWHRDTEPEAGAMWAMLTTPTLAQFYIGIFILHAIFTATFIMLPIRLETYAGFSAQQQWEIYLPTLIISCVLGLTCIGLAERKQRVKPYYIAGVASLIFSLCVLISTPTHFYLTVLALTAFFTGFSMLEAFLPSLVSRTAPAYRKGSAMGIYSSAQFLGIFAGGALGGWLYGQFQDAGVFSFCLALLAFWLFISFFMQAPQFYVTKLFKLTRDQQTQWGDVASNLQLIPGMVEVTFIAEDSIAYLKMERATAKNPEFIRLSEQLQT